jgi:hypothetical protein
MSDQDDMLQAISRMLGPFADHIAFDDGTSFALAKPASLQGPLLGHGDPVAIGDWVQITEYWEYGQRQRLADGGMPWQIRYISASSPYSLGFGARDGAFSCNAGKVGGEFWRTFTKIRAEDVPRYLKEPLPLPEGVTHSALRQLSKQQFLTTFAGQREIVCYVAVVAFAWQPITVVRHEMMPLLLSWEQRAQGRRPTLTSLRPKYTYVNGDFEHWSAGERHIEPDGRIVARKQRYSLCLYSSEGQGSGLLELLEHAQTPEQGVGDE